MKAIVWNADKNRELKSDIRRNICFEDIVAAIEGGGLLDDIRHPNVGKYPNQRMLVVFAKDFAYAVPYIQSAEGIFLKTAFPSRRLESRYRPDGAN